tara:strand:+ start:189 stop:1172 length:984 start_codon:yes stop_codon:yes gene_type:complete
MLPALDRLRLSRTGEFYALSQPELDQFAAEDKLDPITLESFESDSGNGADDWRTFRVRNETPRADGTYKYHYYKASALWQHYDSPTPKKDPLTNQPIWYEDWMALHGVYGTLPNAASFIPSWVYALPTREPDTVKARPSLPPQWRYDDEVLRTMPMTLTPVPVRRQPNIPPQRRVLTEEEQESERLHAVHNRWRERFDRLLQLDDPSTLDALQQAMRGVAQANAAIQEHMDRIAAAEAGPVFTRVTEARLHRWLSGGELTRMEHQVHQARTRWQGGATENALPLPGAPRPMRQNAMPLREEDAQERERMYQETQERLRQQQREREEE